MATEINEVVVSGRIKGTPVLRETRTTETKVLDFQLAHTKLTLSGKTLPNEYACVIFGSYAEEMAGVLSPGMGVVVKGELASRRWLDAAQGKARTRVEIKVELVIPTKTEEQGK